MKADVIVLEWWGVSVILNSVLKLCFRGILLDNIVYGNNEREHIFRFALWL